MAFDPFSTSPISLRVGVSEATRNRARALLSPKDLKKALFVAVRNATRGAKTDIRKEIRETTELKAKYINRVIQTVAPSGDPPTGQVLVSQQLIPLVGYKVRASKRGGVTAIISKDRAPVVLRHAFMAQLRSQQQVERGFEGHRGVVSRSRHLPTKGPNVGGYRFAKTAGGGRRRFKLGITPRGIAGALAVEEQFGPSVVDLIDETKLGEVVLESIATRLENQVESQINRFLGQKTA